jgi:hypothetical protein
MAATDYIAALNSRFSEFATNGRDAPDALTRNFGGSFRNNQPYIHGYFQVFFRLPNKLFNGTEEVAQEWLHSTCEGFTPPGTAVNKVDVTGIGTTGASFPTGVTTTREFQVTFRETQHLAILNIIKTWAGLFDPYTGVSALSGSEFIPPNYKGSCWVALMKPVGAKSDYTFAAEDIEDIYAFDGVFPTSIPTDALNNDITASDTVQYSISFSFDGHPLTRMDEGVLSKTIELLNQKKYMQTHTRFAEHLAQ